MYKKIFVLVVLLLAIVGGTYIFNRYDDSKEVENQVAEKRVYYISGDYIKTERSYRSNWENQPDQKYSCDSFVVTKGDDIFVNKYKELIVRGNSINRLDEMERLVINLDLENISRDMAKKIASSSNKLTLIVSEKDEEGREGGPCYSFLKIQSIQEE